MQQVADWLEKLGLGQYAQRFAENDIDFALLTKLTDANLKELGVTSLGHRMRLLEAIGEHAAVAPPATLAESKASDTAERRQVTVMFSDLVGSTALSARMDPEDQKVSHHAAHNYSLSRCRNGLGQSSKGVFMSSRRCSAHTKPLTTDQVSG
jgi:hypothetical protein